MDENKSKSLSRRRKALLWMIVSGGVISVLIYLEQIAIVYILSTLALILLLLIVAFADLERVGVEDSKESNQSTGINKTELNSN